MGNQQFYGIPAHRYANYLGENVGQYNQHESDEQTNEEHDHMHDLLQALHPQQRQNLTFQDLQQLQRIAQMKREQEERKAERIRLARQRKLEQLRAQQLKKQQEEAAAAAAAEKEEPQFVLVQDPHTNSIKLVQLTPRAAALKQQQQQQKAQQKQQRQQQKYVPFMQDKHFAQEWIQEMSSFAKQYPQYLPLLKKAIEEQEKSNVEKSATPLSSTPLPWSNAPQQGFDFAAAAQKKKQQEDEKALTDEEKNFLNQFASLMGGLHTPTTPKKQRVNQNIFDSPKKPSAQKKLAFAQEAQRSTRRSGMTEQEEIENALEEYTPEELQQIRKIQLFKLQQEKQARMLQEQQRQQALLQEQKRQKELELLEQQQRKAAMEEQQKRLALLKQQQKQQREEPLYMYIPPRGNQPGRIVLNPAVARKMQDEQLVKQREEAAKQKQIQQAEQAAKEAAAEKSKKNHHEFFNQVPVQEVLEHLQKQFEESSSDDEDQKSVEDEILEESLEELEDKWEGKSKKQIPIVFENNEEPKQQAQQQPAAEPQASESSPQGKGPKLEKLQINADQKQMFEHETKLMKIEERINELLKELMEVGAIVSTNHGDSSIVPTLRKLEDALSTQLLSLDKIVTDNDEIRKRRKQNVVRVQNLIAIVEGYLTKVTNPPQQEETVATEQPAAEVKQEQPATQHEESGNVLVQQEEQPAAVAEPAQQPEAQTSVEQATEAAEAAAPVVEQAPSEVTPVEQEAPAVATEQQPAQETPQ